MEHKVVTDYSNVDIDLLSNVKVYVRLRPPDPGAGATAAPLAPTAGAAAGSATADPSHRGLHVDKVFERDTDPAARCVYTLITPLHLLSGVWSAQRMCSGRIRPRHCVYLPLAALIAAFCFCRKITIRDPKNTHGGEHAFAFDKVCEYHTQSP